jgi:CheY-like chemotaxis protein
MTNVLAPAAVVITDVLVIDDNDQFREALAILLASAGYRVTVAADGPAGLRRFAEGRFRVVVTDVHMPGLNGWDVARAVRQATPAVGVVLMSASFDPRDTRAGGGPGRPVTLPKPFLLEELIEIIDRVASPGEEDAA